MSKSEMKLIINIVAHHQGQDYTHQVQRKSPRWAASCGTWCLLFVLLFCCFVFPKVLIIQCEIRGIFLWEHCVYSPLQVGSGLREENQKSRCMANFRKLPTSIRSDSWTTRTVSQGWVREHSDRWDENLLNIVYCLNNPFGTSRGACWSSLWEPIYCGFSFKKWAFVYRTISTAFAIFAKEHREPIRVRPINRIIRSVICWRRSEEPFSTQAH